MLPMHSLPESADRCAEGIVSGATLSCHISRKSSNVCFHCIPFLDRVWRDPVMPHLVQELQRMFHCVPLSKALIAALEVIVSGATLSGHISRKSSNACCHCIPVSQALIAALEVIVSGATLSCHISRQSTNACFHCIPFSQALIAALKVIAFGATLSCLISRKSSRACLHCMPF